MPVSFLRDEEVRRRTGLSRSQRDLLEAQEKFPRRVPLSERAVGWIAEEVDDWVNARVAMRDNPELAAAAYHERLPAPVKHRREPEQLELTAAGPLRPAPQLEG